MSQTLISSGRSRDPVGAFYMVSDSGAVCDLSSLLLDGAKLTVLFDKLCHDWNHHGHTGDWAYVRLRRACIAWEKAGYVSISRKSYCSASVELSERPGLFVRAVAAPPSTPPYLIKGLQNSKSLTAARNGLGLDDGSVQTTLPELAAATAAKLNTGEQHARTHLYGMPGGRISWERQQAIKRCMEISDPSLFVRVLVGSSKQIHPDLQKKLDQMHALFASWKRSVSRKKIVLRKLHAHQLDDPYLILDYKTRFTDNWRAWQNEKTYKNAIKTSLENYQHGVFVTLTTDPQIWMRSKGEQFQRHIKDGNKTYHFDATGRGQNLFVANRHESTAWRKWYEAECHRHGMRIPYIRVVEFQKNGLIHTHILLFGIQWDKPWHEFAQDWGGRYSQGFMNKAYQVENRNGRWVWAHAEQKPDDTKGRDPADYLMKYLRKAQDVPTIKCPDCGSYIPVSEDGKCPFCGAKVKAPHDGRYMYWVCGKRFFTMSQSLRVYDFDEMIERDDSRQTGLYEFLAAPDESLVSSIIRDDRVARSPPLRDVPYIPRPDPEMQEFYRHWPFEDEENRISLQEPESPDVDDDNLADFLGSLSPERIAYEQQLAEEVKLMEERRKRLKRKREERSG